MPTHLVQLSNGNTTRVALVTEPNLEFLQADSLYNLLTTVLNGGMPLTKYIDVARTGKTLSYDAVYNNQSEWKLIAPITHPEPARLFVTGTGLTHLGSAKSRGAMHGNADEANLSDSMKIFRWGVERGKPAAGQIGVAPEWFYKGPGTTLRGHNQPLDWPTHAEDGGEEAEIVGIYLIDPQGHPVRVGMAQGNEFSDHVFEKKNYLNLAGSKLRTSSVGPELVIDAAFGTVPGEVSILRDGKKLWSKPLSTGENEMSHSLVNIEHHHFKFAAHRRPGDVHIHFYGTSALSYADGIRLQEGDVMEVHYQGFGRPLRNPVHIDSQSDKLVAARVLK